MRLVVDSNVLFTFFWKNSALNELLKRDIALFSPEILLDEITKYKSDIMNKAKITEEEFKALKKQILTKVTFIPLNKYASQLKNIRKTVFILSEDENLELENDIDFIALSSLLNYHLWSNDKLLKKLSKIKVLNTKDIITLIDSESK